MAITNATTLADYASGISTQGATLKVDASNKRVGIGTTNPNQMLQVGTAVSVYGNSGIVSATSFYGDGANITGLANTDVINTENLNVIGVTTVGSAVTINSTGIDAVSGVITASSFSGSGANLTGVANTDFINATQLNVIGIATVGTGLSLADNIRAKFGTGGDLEIFHSGSESHILEQGTGGLILNSSVTTIKNPGDSETIARFTENGGVDLNFDNSTKFATHNTGVKVTGIATISSDLNVAGITTVGILTAYDSITVKVGAGSTELTTALSAKASTGKAIAMAMVFG